MEENMSVDVEVNEGVNESEVAEQTEVDEVVETTETQAESDATVQSAEENAHYAAARRKAEAEYNEKLQRDLSARDAEFERRFKGYVNPITQQPIRTERDYFEALDAQETLKRNEELREKGIDPKVFEEAVERQVANNPTLLEAKQIIQQNQHTLIQNAIAEGVKEIQKFDSSIKSVDDILNHESFNTVLGYVQNNMSLVDAYKIANFDNLVAKKSASAKQQAINNAKGTSHLNVTDGVSGGDDGGVDIPQDELPQWKRAFPDLSMKELRKKYNRVI